MDRLLLSSGYIVLVLHLVMTIGFLSLEEIEICEPLSIVDMIYLIAMYLIVIIRISQICFKIGN